MVTVTALINNSLAGNRETSSIMIVAIADGALATRAKNATDAVIAGADTEKQKQEHDKAGQRTVPKL